MALVCDALSSGVRPRQRTGMDRLMDNLSYDASLGRYFGFDWIAMALTFTAIHLLGSERRAGFLIMSTGNIAWTAIGLWAGSYAMGIT